MSQEPISEINKRMEKRFGPKASTKGDWSRVSNQKAYADNWDRIFGAKKKASAEEPNED